MGVAVLIEIWIWAVGGCWNVYNAHLLSLTDVFFRHQHWRWVLPSIDGYFYFHPASMVTNVFTLWTTIPGKKRAFLRCVDQLMRKVLKPEPVSKARYLIKLDLHLKSWKIEKSCVSGHTWCDVYYEESGDLTWQKQPERPSIRRGYWLEKVVNGKLWRQCAISVWNGEASQFLRTLQPFLWMNAFCSGHCHPLGPGLLGHTDPSG